MSSSAEPSRSDLIDLVGRIWSSLGIASDEELERWVAEFCAAVPDPNGLSLLFHWHNLWSEQPSAAEIVDYAMSYSPFTL